MINLLNFFLYFENNWKNNNLLKFHSFSEEKYNFRTNNYLERYHLLLSEIIENFHPKIPFFLDKIKIIIQNYYNDYISDITNLNKKEIYQFDIRKDIVNFILNFQKKYKNRINFLELIQMEIRDLVSLSKTVYNFLDIVFGIENMKETEDLLIKKYDELSKEEKYNMLTKIKFIKNISNKNLEKDNIISEEGLSEEESDISDDSSNNDNFLIIDDSNIDILQISPEIYNENAGKKRKENIMRLLI